MQKRRRIFIAINLPQEYKKRLISFEKKWADVPAKWTPQENLHITVVFLGDITDVELGQVCLATKKVAENQEGFNIDLNKIAYGPEEKIPPRYIWAGGEKSEPMHTLKEELENEISEIVNLKPDKNTFTPHITLARINEWQWRQIELEERPEVNEIIDMTFPVESIEVMESELTKQGPRYTVIESHQFQ
ncbi:MAG: 2'-5' RNA ligase [Candidatus Staskawiczbacteria bacterium RIFCSPHIGHO2_02_FULL_42_22]|uniref:RNA 2',3'-cyclic phosphodiesterase n=1 Tax=Candidatus Staskawiczbacteria bacterium RIFCSPHIGHO2_02_FULL_42_22 TaxID=1802207 RepID=A0A1G2I434_9BACT|nr:MAG: 2'-5' RNA ligase [Candidatus Staskawiczbacteria bacterium RIFCSPHIGHO2_02_FULL_42_22]